MTEEDPRLVTLQQLYKEYCDAKEKYEQALCEWNNGDFNYG